MPEEKINSITVDIPVATYNHEKYIAQTIEGVVSQITNFKIRMIIGEDASTDNTRAIIETYQKKYPDIIFPFYREKNVGPFINSKLLFAECKSKYVALCEGDDYWTNPYKLQKQVDFLESDPAFVICYHDVEKVFDDDCVDAEIIAREDDQREISDIYDLADGNFIYTPSCVFRNMVDHIPSWFYDCILCDWLLYLLITEQSGKIYHIKEKMAVYRIHNGGIFSTNNSMNYDKQLKINSRLIFQLEQQIKYFNSNKRITGLFKKKLFLALNKLRILALRNKDFITARQTSLKMISLLGRKIPEFKMAASLFFSAGFPGTYSKYLMGKKQFSD